MPTHTHIFTHARTYTGFPSGSVVQEPTCQCRRHGFQSLVHVPQSNEAHEPQLLSLGAATAEGPQSLSSMRKATAKRSPSTPTKSSPRCPGLEKAHAQQREVQCNQKEQKVI